METQGDLVDILRRSILDDLFKDFNQTGRFWLRGLIEPLVQPSVKRFAQIAADFDARVERSGFHFIPSRNPERSHASNVPGSVKG